MRFPPEKWNLSQKSTHLLWGPRSNKMHGFYFLMSCYTLYYVTISVYSSMTTVHFYHMISRLYIPYWKEFRDKCTYPAVMPTLVYGFQFSMLLFTKMNAAFSVLSHVGYNRVAADHIQLGSHCHWRERSRRDPGAAGKFCCFTVGHWICPAVVWIIVILLAQPKIGRVSHCPFRFYIVSKLFICTVSPRLHNTNFNCANLKTNNIPRQKKHRNSKLCVT